MNNDAFSPKNHADTPECASEAAKLYSAFKPKIDWKNVEHLRSNPRNARTHNRKQRRAMVASIRRLGFINPLIIDANDTVIAGDCRLDAAKEMGLVEVPVILIDHLNDDEIRAFALADNQLAAMAGWDDEMLAIELQHLVEVNFDLDVTGFEAAKIDFVIESQLSGPGDNRADIIPEAHFNEPPTSRIGDIWLLGKHRLMCGDALNEFHLRLLMLGVLARMLFSDPPYNVKIDGNVCGLGDVRHREFLVASGEMSRKEFRAFLLTVMLNAARHSMDGAIHYWCMDWRSIDILLDAGREVFERLINICVWNKTNAGMGSFYRSQHEFVAVLKHGTEPHMNNIQLGKNGRNRSNVWIYPGVNTFRKGRMDELKNHPTSKPAALVSDAIRDASKRGDVVVDPFMGSGTTIIGAEETGRVAYGMELDPHYVDVAVMRWQAFTGGAAVHEGTGKTFDETTASRNVAVPLLPAPTACGGEGQNDD